MDVNAYFISLTAELNALKNRVRNFIADAHWQTDGEWKESVLRATLRRHLPASIEVARGFVISIHGCSKQIDVLLYDTAKPILYRDGDLVFVTADAVRGIIEVKSKASVRVLQDGLRALAENSEFINKSRSLSSHKKNLFVGLFAYEIDLGLQPARSVLDSLQVAAQTNRDRVVTHVCLGHSLFVRFWAFNPTVDTPYGVLPYAINYASYLYWERHQQPVYNRWHFYKLRNLAPGYFINNVVEAVSGPSVALNIGVWFPLEGKESKKIADVPL